MENIWDIRKCNIIRGIVLSILIMSCSPHEVSCRKNKDFQKNGRTNTIQENEISKLLAMPINDSNSVSCTSNRGELMALKQMLQAQIFEQLQHTVEIPNGYQFYFKDTPELAQKLLKYISIEKKCCAFMQFDLSMSGSTDTIVLKVSGPEGTKAMIEILLLQ